MRVDLETRASLEEILHEAFGAGAPEIQEIIPNSMGMTNRSYCLRTGRGAFMARIPGHGAQALIDRDQEAEVYRRIKGLGICDEPLYINPRKGYKLSHFYEQVRLADPRREEDLRAVAQGLYNFHRRRLTVPHHFDLWTQIHKYMHLCRGVYPDYPDLPEILEQIKKAYRWTLRVAEEQQLCHLDAVDINWMFTPEGLLLIDWEYAAMQDPDLDFAMFIIYANYSREEADHFIDLCFAARPEGLCPPQRRRKLYAYMALGGFLWTFWCQYKAQLGQHFGSYQDEQYAYAQEYLPLLKADLEEN